jgi:tripartite-type tricarboxylate transporter receptor subunit TctC
MLKDLPTLDEAGLKNFQVTIWHGLYAPKGTPAPVLKKLNDALKVALKDPDFIKPRRTAGRGGGHRRPHRTRRPQEVRDR